jgi:hypothetical protein
LSLLRTRHEVNLPMATCQSAVTKQDAFDAACVGLATAFHGGTANLGLVFD